MQKQELIIPTLQEHDVSCHQIVKLVKGITYGVDELIRRPKDHIFSETAFFSTFQDERLHAKIESSLYCTVRWAQNSNTDAKGLIKPFKKGCVWKKNLRATDPVWFELKEGPCFTPAHEKKRLAWAKIHKGQYKSKGTRRYNEMSQLFSFSHHVGPQD